jgi:hypothetical protein
MKRSLLLSRWFAYIALPCVASRTVIDEGPLNHYPLLMQTGLAKEIA